MKLIRVVGFFWGILFWGANTFAATPVEFRFGPEASPIVIELLATSQYFKDSVDVSGFVPGQPFGQAECRAAVQRPVEHEAPTLDPRNQVTCSFTYEGGASGQLRWSLGQIPIDSWGNRFDRLPFQFKDQPALEMLHLIRMTEESRQPTPLIGHWYLCGPDGFCTETYFVAHEAQPDSRGAVLCTQDFQYDVPYRVACTFMP